jgi:hypothetical protein
MLAVWVCRVRLVPCRCSLVGSLPYLACYLISGFCFSINVIDGWSITEIALIVRWE